MYAGSGYGADPMMSGQPGAYPPPNQTQAENKDFQQYTEQAMLNLPDSNSENMIDENTGLHPRRLTDCVCIWIFLAYIIGMFIVTGVAMSRADTSRLTRGYDYFGRLCGVDVDVADKPYLYWCRQNAWELKSVMPAAVATEFPICVKQTTAAGHCPTATSILDYDLLCLQKHVEDPTATAQEIVPVGAELPFMLAKTKFISVTQNIVHTQPYDTELFMGRYCMPANNTLRAPLLAPISGPVNWGIRSWKVLAAFKNLWLVSFTAALLSCLISVALVFLFKSAAVTLVRVLYLFIGLIFFLFGLFFVSAFPIALAGLLPIDGDSLAATTPFAELEEINPFFKMMRQLEGGWISTILGVVLIVSSFPMFMTALRATDIMTNVMILIEIAYTAMFTMDPKATSMIVFASFEALLKWTLSAILLHQYMYIVTVGDIDDRLIVLNGLQMQGPSKKYVPDFWFTVFASVYYLVGAAWILEVCTQFGQCARIEATVMWYFTAKAHDGQKYPSVFKFGPLNLGLTAEGMAFTFTQHLGSVAYLSFPFYLPNTGARLRRLYTFFFYEWIDGVSPGSKENCCMRLCHKVFSCFRTISSKFACAGCGETTADKEKQYSKFVYNDIVIRSTHYDKAQERAPKYLDAAKGNVGQFLFGGTIMVFAGVTFAATLGAVLAYIFFVCIPAFSDYTSGWYVQDPIFSTLICFIICANCSYSYMACVDDIMDCTLYCYAFQKKTKKAKCDEYMPDKLEAIVGFDHRNADGYTLYGSNVPAEMYLATWFGGGAAAAAPAKAAPAQGAAPMGTQAVAPMGTQGPPAGTMPPGQGGDPYGSQYGGQGPYANQSPYGAGPGR